MRLPLLIIALASLSCGHADGALRAGLVCDEAGPAELPAPHGTER